MNINIIFFKRNVLFEEMQTYFFFCMLKVQFTNLDLKIFFSAVSICSCLNFKYKNHNYAETKRWMVAKELTQLLSNLSIMKYYKQNLQNLNILN